MSTLSDRLKESDEMLDRTRRLLDLIGESEGDVEDQLLTSTGALQSSYELLRLCRATRAHSRELRSGLRRLREESMRLEAEIENRRAKRTMRRTGHPGGRRAGLMRRSTRSGRHCAQSARTC